MCELDKPDLMRKSSGTCHLSNSRWCGNAPNKPPDCVKTPSTHTPTFGVPVAGVTYEQRCAAYAVIRNSVGAVAAVQVPAGYWLPGGGMLPGETPEETVVREVREELGCTLRLVRKIGEAVQYFYAATEGRYYAMQATFFRAKLVGGPRGA